jgi:hypothetical protein
MNGSKHSQNLISSQRRRKINLYALNSSLRLLRYVFQLLGRVTDCFVTYKFLKTCKWSLSKEAYDIPLLDNTRT